MSDPNRLKYLRSKLARLREELDQTKADKSEIVQQIQRLEAGIAMTRKQLQELSDMDPTVSEHAILRYAERFLGLDVDQIQQQILNDKAREMLQFTRNGKVRCNGVEMIVKNNVVVSLYPAKGADNEQPNNSPS